MQASQRQHSPIGSVIKFIGSCLAVSSRRGSELTIRGDSEKWSCYSDLRAAGLWGIIQFCWQFAKDADHYISNHPRQSCSMWVPGCSSWIGNCTWCCLCLFDCHTHPTWRTFQAFFKVTVIDGHVAYQQIMGRRAWKRRLQTGFANFD